MSNQNTEQLDTYNLWLGRAVTKGTPLAPYNCPDCAVLLHTNTPPVGQVWDALSNCPACGVMFFKVCDNKTGYPVVTITDLRKGAAL